MVVDASAVIAIAQEEPEARSFAEAVARAPIARISVGNLIEAAIVIDQRGSRRSRFLFDGLPVLVGLRIESVTEQHYHLARDAYRRFGKGNHPAGLNFGDCFAYALAMATGEPLLFKGDDFARTDIPAAA